MRKLWLIGFVGLFLVGAGRLFADDTIPTLFAAVRSGKDGKLVLEVQGKVVDASNWLGMSFYTPNYLDPIWDADHAVAKVNRGSFDTLISVPDGFLSGTFEVALWKDKVADKEVFRLDSIRGYGAGAVASGSYKPDSTWTAPLLKTDIETKGAKTILAVSGVAPDKSDQLGVSFYRAGYSDPVLDGDYSIHPVEPGSFAKRYTVPDGFETGTYEVALWSRLIARKHIYRLSGQRAYTSGVTTK